MEFPPWKRRCLEAVAVKRLPVLPGDYVLFKITGSRLLITMAMPCEPNDNEARGEPTMGQQVVGLVWSPTEGSSLKQFWLDWCGYEDYWTIHRMTV